ncbi:MAG: metallophosphoesterase family protein [Planctomycetaceae bacterium]|nr:metallophosphoesterase family protein [Planctomycetaceae bacterium]
MRILVLADIHANWPALRAIARAEPDCDECLVLGDLVDYGVSAREVIRWVQAHASQVIRGNHDHAVAQFIRRRPHVSGLKQFLNETRQIHWQELNCSELNYLGGLPTQLTLYRDGLKLRLLHATPRDPLGEYLLPDVTRWEEPTRNLQADILLVGHTHIPFEIECHGLRIVNPGSVGQPRDGIASASYAVLEQGHVEFKRIAYDYTETLTDLSAAGISEESLVLARKILEPGTIDQ